MEAQLPTPLEGSCRAYYEDGFIYDETAMQDVSPFTKKNIFDDIYERYPEKAHGKLVRFTVFHDGYRYDYDFSKLPDNARPIRFRHMEADSVNGQVTEVRLMGVDAGFQYNDETGKNVQHVDKLRPGA